MRGTRRNRLLAVSLVLASGPLSGSHPARAATCSFGSGTLTVTLEENGGDEVVIGRSTAGAVEVSSNGSSLFCGGTTVSSVDRIDVVCGPDGPDADGLDGCSGDEAITIDQSNGAMGPGITAEADGTNEIEINRPNLGEGAADTVIITATNSNDTIIFGVGGVNPNGDSDVDMTFVDRTTTETYTVNGGAGDDSINLSGGSGTGNAWDRATNLNGGNGNDTVTGGTAADTFAQGASPDGADRVRGGPGTDTVDYATRSISVTVTRDDITGDGEPGEDDDIGSDIERVLLPAVQLGPPRDVEAAGSRYEATVTWSAPAVGEATAYHVYGGDAPGTDRLLATIEALSYLDAPLPAASTRYYRVSAVNETGEGPSAPEVSATTLEVLGAPREVLAAPGNGVITLTWEPPAADGGSAVIAYRVYGGEGPGSDALLATVEDGRSYSDAPLPNDATRYYSVTAVNAVEEGPRSSEVSATTFDLPGAPRDLAAVPGPGLGEVTLSWAEPATDGGTSVTAFRIFRGDRSGTRALVAEVPYALSYTDRDLTPLFTKYYVVEAVNVVGAGPPSAEACAKPFPWLAELGC